MASTSIALKSKRSKKADGSEWEDGNASNEPKSPSAKDATRGKRMKTDESGIDIAQESDPSDVSSENIAAEEPLANSAFTCVYTRDSNTRAAESTLGSSGYTCVYAADSSREAAGDQSTLANRGFTRRGSSETSRAHREELDRDSGDPESPESSSPPPQASSREINDSVLVDQYALDMSSMRAEAEMLNSSDDNSDAEIEGVTPAKETLKKFDPTPNTPLPKHGWSPTNVFTSRQYGYSSKYSPDLFRYNCYGSLHMVERLELMYKMKKHEGCVNALHYNSSGTKLVSGSDDLNVIVWDWAIGKPLIEYKSGHNTNVFQVIWFK